MLGAVPGTGAVTDRCAATWTCHSKSNVFRAFHDVTAVGLGRRS